MDRRINIEYRTKNSERPYYNSIEKWLPRYLIWPTYEGLCTDRYEEKEGEAVDNSPWGEIVSGSLRSFSKRLSLRWVPVGFTKGLRFIIKLREPMWQIPSEFFDWRGNKYHVELRSEYINALDSSHDYGTYFILTKKSEEQILSILNREQVSRGGRLTESVIKKVGECALKFGNEEPLIELLFIRHQDIFLEQLKRTTEKYNYKYNKTRDHFLSHWIIANKKKYINKYGGKWNVL